MTDKTQSKRYFRALDDAEKLNNSIATMAWKFAERELLAQKAIFIKQLEAVFKEGYHAGLERLIRKLKDES